jgi:formate-dependent nitrite reductase membrane component NrfD
MTSYERQTTFGWLIVVDTFLAGAGGGAFLAAFILDILGKYEPIARIGSLLGPLLSMTGAIFLMADLGSKRRSYRLLSNRSSWISKGSLITVAFILLGLVYSVPSLWIADWTTWRLGRGIGVIAAVFSILTALYPGFLFSVIKAIPFWNTSVLPILFLFSSWCTGLAATVISAQFLPTGLGVAGFHEFGVVMIVLGVICLIISGGYLEVARHGSASSRASVQLLRRPLFIYGIIVLGLASPIGLLSWSVVVSDIHTLSVLAGVSSLLLLSGGFLIRHGILKAGVYQPLR